MTEEMKEIAEIDDNTGIASIPADLREQASEQDDGADVELRPRLRIDGGIELVVGNDVRDFPDGIDVIALSVKPITRELRDTAYDADNPQPPSCFSLDGETPHELANPPMTVNRQTGDMQPATGCRTDCPGERNGYKCGYKRQVTCVVPDNINSAGLISFPVPSMGIFNKGDVEKNPDPENRTGLLNYIEKVKSVGTDGEPIKLFQIVTNITAHKVKGKGETVTFSFRDKDSGNINATSPDQLRKCIELMGTEEYTKVNNSYENYLITGAKMKKEAEEAEVTDDAPPPVADNIDDLKEANK